MAENMLFKTRRDFRKWLHLNPSHQGIWLVFGKDDTHITLTPSEALEEALCFGWIDGLIQKIDGSTYRKYFSPRRKGSRWSERNKQLVAKLIGEKLMTPRGLEMVEQAKKDGIWDAVQNRTIPDEKFIEFERHIKKSRHALENFKKMPGATRRMFVGFYFEAKKEETRKKRLAHLIGLLEQNKRPMS